MTHVDFLRAVQALAVARIRAKDPCPSASAASAAVERAVVVYGVSPRVARGECFFSKWKDAANVHTDLVHINTAAEESVTQLAGTLLHELAHVVAGFTAGHCKQWDQACVDVGLVYCRASGQQYAPEHFDPLLWDQIRRVAPVDGQPLFADVAGGMPLIGTASGKGTCCPMGWRTKGGKSRGKGSGTRHRLWVCGCLPTRRIRMAGSGQTESDIQCLRCGLRFVISRDGREEQGGGK